MPAVDDWAAELRLAATPATVRAYLGAVRSLMAHAGATDPADLTRADVVAWLRREDVDSGGISVRGKGDKVRWVPITDERVARALLGRPGGWIFPGRFGGHLHPGTVARWVKEATGSPPHRLRHRFASVAYDGTGDLLAVQQLLGHASPATTQIYVGLPAQRLRAAAAAAVVQRRPLHAVSDAAA